MNTEFFEAVKILEKEKGVPAELLYEKIQTAIIVAVRKNYHDKDVVCCEIKPEESELNVFLHKTVVNEISDPDTDILTEEAQKYKPSALPGDIVEIPLEPKQFGRIAAQTVKHVIRQGIREAERGQVMQEFQSRQQEITTAKVTRVDPVSGNATLEIGRAEAVLPKGEQVPGETIAEGDLIKVYIVDVRESEKGGPKAIISRTHPGLVKRLFETEVPEIYDGIVKIMGVARDPGSKAKLAVRAEDVTIDPVGACVGLRGIRVQAVVTELQGEKIDIIPYSEDRAQYMVSALAPAEVSKVVIDEENNRIEAVVPKEQFSIAIGRRGHPRR